jgi:hypothetical protein
MLKLNEIIHEKRLSENKEENMKNLRSILIVSFLFIGIHSQDNNPIITRTETDNEIIYSDGIIDATFSKENKFYRISKRHTQNIQQKSLINQPWHQIDPEEGYFTLQAAFYEQNPEETMGREPGMTESPEEE